MIQTFCDRCGGKIPRKKESKYKFRFFRNHHYQSYDDSMEIIRIQSYSKHLCLICFEELEKWMVKKHGNN